MYFQIVPLIVIAVSVANANAVCNPPEDVLTGPGVQHVERFGWEVEARDGLAMITARRAAGGAGEVHLFERTPSGWQAIGIIDSPDPTPGTLFGDSVWHDGTRAVISATHADTVPVGSGALYVYELDQGVWTHVQTLVPDNSFPFDFFGFTVDVDGDFIVSGSSQSDLAAPGPGAAYVFDQSGPSWSQAQKLTSSMSAPGDRFGEHVAIKDNVIVVGAWGEEAGKGAAYMFERVGGQFVETQRLQPPGLPGGAEFGIGIDFSSDALIIGAFRETGSAIESGAAYVYRATGPGGAWEFSQKLLPVGGGAFAGHFGVRLTALDKMLIVGAIDDESAHLFMDIDGTWLPIKKLRPSTSINFDLFGFSTAIDGNEALISAWNSPVPGSGSADRPGIVYALDLSNCLVGACCVSFGCITLAEDICLVNNGTFAGVAVGCSSDPCTTCSLPGDLNADGLVRGDDIPGFVRAKLNLAALPGENADCADYGTGTLNGDTGLFVQDLLNSP